MAVLRNNFLPYSETFIHDQLRSHQRYAPWVLARRVQNAERFAGHEVTAIARGNFPSRLASLVYGVTGRASRFDHALEDERVKLIHAHFGHNGAYAVAFARRHRLPLVVSLHGHDVTALLSRERFRPQWWFYLLRSRALLGETTLFLAASAELARLIIQAGAPEQSVRVHRLGVDVEALMKLSRPSGAQMPTMMMVGRFVEKKGHEFGLRAAALLWERGYRFKLNLVGDGPLKPRYLQLVRELGIAEAVVFHGSLSHQSVLAQMSEAQLLMTPSVVAQNLDRESGVIVVKEASALGIPVVGTNHGGIPEIIDDGSTGLLVGERDPQALAASVARLLDDEPFRVSLGQAAQRKMREQYDLGVSSMRLEDFYDEARAIYAERNAKTKRR